MSTAPTTESQQAERAKAEKPAEPAKAEEKKADEPAKTEEKKADEPAKAEEKKAEPAKAEEKKADEPAKAEEKKAEPAKAEEKKADEPAKTEEKKADEPAKAESKPAEPAKAEEKKAEEPQPKNQSQQQSSQQRKSASPDPHEQAPPAYLRGTAASAHRASPSRPADKPAPPTVAELAKLSAMDRVKREHQLKMNHIQHNREKGKAAFGVCTTSTSPRSVKQVEHVSPQQQRARQEQHRRHMARFKTGASLDTSDASPMRSHNAERESAGSWFSKSKLSGDRHQFQRIWPARGFPLAVVQKIFSPAAPGPGAYAPSASFVRADAATA